MAVSLLALVQRPHRHGRPLFGLPAVVEVARQRLLPWQGRLWLVSLDCTSIPSLGSRESCQLLNFHPVKRCSVWLAGPLIDITYGPGHYKR